MSFSSLEIRRKKGIIISKIAYSRVYAILLMIIPFLSIIISKIEGIILYEESKIGYIDEKLDLGLYRSRTPFGKSMRKFL